MGQSVTCGPAGPRGRGPSAARLYPGRDTPVPSLQQGSQLAGPPDPHQRRAARAGPAPSPTPSAAGPVTWGRAPGPPRRAASGGLEGRWAHALASASAFSRRLFAVRRGGVCVPASLRARSARCRSPHVPWRPELGPVGGSRLPVPGPGLLDAAEGAARPPEPEPSPCPAQRDPLSHPNSLRRPLRSVRVGSPASLAFLCSGARPASPPRTPFYSLSAARHPVPPSHRHLLWVHVMVPGRASLGF